jgi:Flp pilus assembly protein CpaB
MKNATLVIALIILSVAALTSCVSTKNAENSAWKPKNHKIVNHIAKN